MTDPLSRRNFLRLSAIAGITIGMEKQAEGMGLFNGPSGLRVGIIGLDVSHSVVFTKLLNAPDAPKEYGGYKVVAAYPKGSNDIATSTSRIPEFTKQVQALGVTIVTSVDELLGMVDVVMLNTNDGRLHLRQAIQVFKSGKRMFIDKPFAADLKDVAAIFKMADSYHLPVFSASSLRYMENRNALKPDQIGEILGVDTYSPATLEKTHTDLFWYGIHGVEMLYTLLGTGCKTVRRIYTPNTDIVIGSWPGNRLGTFRGTRTGPHDYGGIVFGEKATVPIQPANGFDGLMRDIIRFFQTGKSPVPAAETMEIYAFMQAADESKKQGGAVIEISDVMKTVS